MLRVRVERAPLCGCTPRGQALSRRFRATVLDPAEGAPDATQPEAEAGKKDDSNVVDAEFTEVKDKKAG